MDNSKRRYYKALFIFASLYDWILGAAFLFFYKPLFGYLMIDMPANPSYMSLAAAFVFVSGFLYYFAVKNPKSSRELILMGIIYKLFYVGVGIYYSAIGILPHLIFMIFGVADAIFTILFIEFLNYTKKYGAID